MQNLHPHEMEIGRDQIEIVSVPQDIRIRVIRLEDRIFVGAISLVAPGEDLLIPGIDDRELGKQDKNRYQDMWARWLAFSCFTPIMEVGPTRNVAFWNLPHEPTYDATLIAVWRLYARLHQRLVDYSFAQAKEAARAGLPIVRPLFLADPKARSAWSNWWTFLYGKDLLVSPLWEKDRRSQEVYLPSGERWRDAWRPGMVYNGGQTITVESELYQIPLFVREGSGLDLGDLPREWRESTEIAGRKPDLKALDAEATAWFGKNKKS
jgi:alpha-D-xyloside xylohydrolase